jgi:hypothetical protein
MICPFVILSQLNHWGFVIIQGRVLSIFIVKNWSDDDPISSQKISTA